MRTVALGQDAEGLPAEAGLTHADFRVGDPVGPAHIFEFISTSMAAKRSGWCWGFVTAQ